MIRRTLTALLAALTVAYTGVAGFGEPPHKPQLVALAMACILTVAFQLFTEPTTDLHKKVAECLARLATVPAMVAPLQKKLFKV